MAEAKFPTTSPTVKFLVEKMPPELMDAVFTKEFAADIIRQTATLVYETRQELNKMLEILKLPERESGPSDGAAPEFLMLLADKIERVGFGDGS